MSHQPLREAHVHLASLGRATTMLRLDGCARAGDVLDEVAKAATRTPAGAWVLGGGARSDSWPDPSWPALDALDRAAGGRPCALWSFDHHALMASSAALALAGLGPGTPDPPGGVIVREPHSGRPTGLLLEKAALALWERVPEPTPDERRSHVRSALDRLRGLGFVQVHDLLSQDWLGPLLAAMDDRGELSAEVTLFPPVERVEDQARSARAWARDRVRLGGGKLFADGTLGSRTAWVLHAYDPAGGRLESHPFGTPMHAPGAIEDAVRRTDRLGLPLATHAIGDAAVRAVLDAIERVAPRTPGYRIEHAELIDAADVPRFAALGVVASVQPCHLLTDVEVLRGALPHRLDRVLPLRDLIDAGCRPGELLWFGSDAPIVRPDPVDSVVAAVTRRRPGDGPERAIAPEQAIREDEAWAAFAPGAATRAETSAR